WIIIFALMLPRLTEIGVRLANNPDREDLDFQSVGFYFACALLTLRIESVSGLNRRRQMRKILAAIGKALAGLGGAMKYVWTRCKDTGRLIASLIPDPGATAAPVMATD